MSDLILKNIKLRSLPPASEYRSAAEAIDAAQMKAASPLIKQMRTLLQDQVLLGVDSGVGRVRFSFSNNHSLCVEAGESGTAAVAVKLDCDNIIPVESRNDSFHFADTVDVIWTGDGHKFLWERQKLIHNLIGSRLSYLSLHEFGMSLKCFQMPEVSFTTSMIEEFEQPILFWCLE